MPDLFTQSDAVISPCGLFRYRLSRTWDTALPIANWIGLNPSTADATLDDPTIRRVVSFSKGFGCGGIVMLNLFAYRATDPSELKKVIDPVGPDNDAAILEATPLGVTIAAWGAHPFAVRRVKQVLELLAGVYLRCLGVTKEGAPRHPLYVKSDAPLQPFGMES